MRKEVRIVGIIGLGLMGCSLAAGLKKSGFASIVLGLDMNKNHEKIALMNGYVDEIAGIDKLTSACCIIAICTPVDTISPILQQILKNGSDLAVTDLGSVKGVICSDIDDHPGRSSYVPSHPMAGTENAGPVAANPDLFSDKTCIICDPEKSHPDALNVVIEMYKSLKMNIVFMNSRGHDKCCSLLSHLSHACAFALALTAIEKSEKKEDIKTVAGGGFKSAVRIAMSSPEMWVPIFMQNKVNIVRDIDAFIEKLNEIRAAIITENKDDCFEMILKANGIRTCLGSEAKSLQNFDCKQF